MSNEQAKTGRFIASDYFPGGPQQTRLAETIASALRATAEAARRDAVTQCAAACAAQAKDWRVYRDHEDQGYAASECAKACLALLDPTSPTDLAALKEAVVDAAAADYSDALAMCGGDGLGCDMYRKYHPRRCSECPMHLSIIEPCAALVAAQQKDPTP